MMEKDRAFDVEMLVESDAWTLIADESLEQILAILDRFPVGFDEVKLDALPSC